MDFVLSLKMVNILHLCVNTLVFCDYSKLHCIELKLVSLNSTKGFHQ